MTIQDVEKAKLRLKDIIHNTPLEHSTTFSAMAGCDVYLKCENLQKTGSFKIRGAYNKISEIQEQSETKSIVASSAGNHAQGVAYAANRLGIQATIVMPKTTPIIKAKATEGYGANVLLHGSYYDDAYKKAIQINEETGAVFIHPFNDASVIAGQSTIGNEILEALPNVDMVFVSAGGGGLLAGISFYLKSINPRIKIIGVQAEGADAIFKSFHQKKPITLSSINTIADGIAVKKPGDIPRTIIDTYVDDIVTVTDAEISSAILTLLERNKLMVEPAGAASLAAILSGKVEVQGKRCVAVLSGGNIDVSFIHKIIENGLIARNRKLKFKTIMRDIPGSLESFAKIMSDNYANIIMVQYDRMSATLDLRDVILHIACEVADEEHGKKVICYLEKSGYKVFMD